MSVEDLFRRVIADAGMTPPDDVIADRKLHRFSPTGKRRDDAGWYIVFPDRIPAGVFGDWRSGKAQTWCAKADRELDPAERRVLRETYRRAQLAREAETLQRQAETAKTAAALWAQATPAIAHPYLQAKNVKAHAVRIDGELLLVPVRDADAVLRSLQTIAPDGEKRFLPGGKVKGCYHSIGRFATESEKLLVCEGYSTGATLHESTKCAVAVAFHCGNLEPVALALRQKYPRAELIVCADDDWRTEGNPGLTAARRAAAAAGAKLTKPNFKSYLRSDHDTDFNDLCRLADAKAFAEPVAEAAR